MPSGSEAITPPTSSERLRTVDERTAFIRGALERHGEGFLAYLIRGEADYADSGMVERFTRCYAGWYPDRSTFVRHELDSFDWAAVAEDFLDELGLPAGALTIDETSFFEHLTELYAVEERLGGVHVFTR